MPIAPGPGIGEDQELVTPCWSSMCVTLEYSILQQLPEYTEAGNWNHSGSGTWTQALPYGPCMSQADSASNLFIT